VGQDNDSVVLCVSYGDIDFLLTGNVSQKAEKDILNREPQLDLEAEVLKVRHHGSTYASTSEFLTEAGTEIALTSLGRNDSYGRPAAQTLGRLEDGGATIRRIGRRGTIMVTTDGSAYSITVERSLYFVPPIFEDFVATPQYTSSLVPSLPTVILLARQSRRTRYSFGSPRSLDRNPFLLPIPAIIHNA